MPTDDKQFYYDVYLSKIEIKIKFDKDDKPIVKFYKDGFCVSPLPAEKKRINDAIKTIIKEDEK